MRQEIIYNSMGFTRFHLGSAWASRSFWWDPVDHESSHQPDGHEISGWWLTYPSEKYDFVSWDDYPQYMKWKKKHVWNHQPDMIKPSSSRLDHTRSFCASWSSCVFVTCPCARTTVPGAAGTCKRMLRGQPSKKLHPVSASAIFANHLRISKD